MLNIGSSSISDIKDKQILPEEQYNLTEVKKYLKESLINGVSKFITSADLINNPRSRTPQNIFLILTRILELFHSKNIYAGDKSATQIKIFFRKNPKGTLVGMLGKNTERYKDDPNLLLQDLNIFDAYYKIQINENRDVDTTSIVDSSVHTLHEAFNVVMRNEITKDESYKFISSNEFRLNKDGNIAFSNKAHPLTIMKKDIVHKIQQVFEDILLLENN